MFSTPNNTGAPYTVVRLLLLTILLCTAVHSAGESAEPLYEDLIDDGTPYNRAVTNRRFFEYVSLGRQYNRPKAGDDHAKDMMSNAFNRKELTPALIKLGYIKSDKKDKKDKNDDKKKQEAAVASDTNQQSIGERKIQNDGAARDQSHIALETDIAIAESTDSTPVSTIDNNEIEFDVLSHISIQSGGTTTCTNSTTNVTNGSISIVKAAPTHKQAHINLDTLASRAEPVQSTSTLMTGNQAYDINVNITSTEEVNVRDKVKKITRTTVQNYVQNEGAAHDQPHDTAITTIGATEQTQIIPILMADEQKCDNDQKEEEDEDDDADAAVLNKIPKSGVSKNDQHKDTAHEQSRSSINTAIKRLEHVQHTETPTLAEEIIEPIGSFEKMIDASNIIISRNYSTCFRWTDVFIRTHTTPKTNTTSKSHSITTSVITRSFELLLACMPIALFIIPVYYLCINKNKPNNNKNNNDDENSDSESTNNGSARVSDAPRLNHNVQADEIDSEEAYDDGYISGGGGCRSDNETNSPAVSKQSATGAKDLTPPTKSAAGRGHGARRSKRTSEAAAKKAATKQAAATAANAAAKKRAAKKARTKTPARNKKEKTAAAKNKKKTKKTTPKRKKKKELSASESESESESQPDGNPYSQTEATALLLRCADKILAFKAEVGANPGEAMNKLRISKVEVVGSLDDIEEDQLENLREKAKELASDFSVNMNIIRLFNLGVLMDSMIRSTALGLASITQQREARAFIFFNDKEAFKKKKNLCHNAFNFASIILRHNAQMFLFVCDISKTDLIKFLPHSHLANAFEEFQGVECFQAFFPDLDDDE